MTITLTREEAQQVLDVIEKNSVGTPRREASDMLRARLAQSEKTNQCGETCERAKLCAICARGIAQPEPEPVAWFSKLPDNKIAIKIVGKPTEGDWKPLYTDPPQREWQGLTDEGIKRFWSQALADTEGETYLPLTEFARAIEAKLKEKNT
jgi:hypothetical protein